MADGPNNWGAFHSIEAEQAVLGALMISEEAWDEISDVLTTADFYRHDHRLIFAAIQHLAEAGKPRDAVTMSTTLEEFRELSEAGGNAYLGVLIKNTGSAHNIRAYADVVRKRSQLRSLYMATNSSHELIVDPELDIAEKISRITEKLEGVLSSSSDDEAKSAREAARGWADHLTATFQAGSSITGVRTGFPELDKAIRGLNRKRMVVIAARPSMGKSTLAVNIATNICKAGGSVFLSTMEMSSDDVMAMMCSAFTGCDYEKLQNAAMGDEDVQAATGAFMAVVRDWKLTIDDRGTQTSAGIRRGVKRHMRKHGDCVVIVDYAQLMTEKGESEVNRIGLISRGMKLIAQDLNIPAVLLSQLSRKCEERPDKRPMLSDLRGSGDIEQDASEVLFLYDDSVYHPNTTAAGFTELIIAKNRHGKRGIVIPLLKQFNRARFVTPDYRDMPENWRGESREPTKRRPL